MDIKTIQAIEAILKRGNDAEIRRKGGGYVVIEIKETIKYSPPPIAAREGAIGASYRGNPAVGSLLFLSHRKEYIMKAEFLQNFKIGETPLPKEIINAILTENNRDIEAAKRPFADYDAVKEQLRTATEGLKAFENVDISDLQAQVSKLTQDLADKEKSHREQLATLEFDSALKDAITAAKGRSVKAVRAMLDVDALKASKNRDADIKAALEVLKKDSSYLFETAETPPPYAFGAGTSAPPPADAFHFGFTGVRTPNQK